MNGLRLEPGHVTGIPRPIPDRIRLYLDGEDFCGSYPEARRIRNMDVEPPPEPRGHLYFFGVIRYCDDRGQEDGITRLSVFRRRWNKAAWEFERTGNPDHEYAD